MGRVVICSAVRTAIGSFGGTLAGVSAVELGAFAAKAALERASVPPESVDEVVVGNVLQAGLGQNMARQVALAAGLPNTVTAQTLNMVCGSGLRAVALAAQMIKAGDAGVVLAGGAESMSNAPYVLDGHRSGIRMGHSNLTDVMIKDGLWDAFHDYHMGVTAENIAKKEGITRAEQDSFALQSQQRAQAAICAGRFVDEIVPIPVPQRKGEPVMFATDEYPRFNATLAGLEKLRPSFQKDGTVTAGNASGINDGAAMLVVADEEKAKELGLSVLAVIKSYASAGVDPAVMGMGVVPAVQAAFKKAGLTVNDIDLAELNEAFAVQALAVTRQLGISSAIVNVNGGAIALGHPIGASGARILTTLLYEMRRTDKKLGLAALCIGGGMGTAMIVERI